MKTLAIVSVALTISLLGTAYASAPNSPAAVVHYDDLDISTTRGSGALLKRLEGAARIVCIDFDPIAGLAEPLSLRGSLPRLHEECMQQAVDGAVAKINRSDFTAYVASLKAPKADYAKVVAQR